MNYEEERRRYISFCGSYCRTCDWFTGKIKRTFQSARALLEEYGFRRLLEGRVDIENLKRGMLILADAGICSGCKAEIAPNRVEDRCEIRQCCYGKGFYLCSECPQFPCERLKTNPGVIKFHCLENLTAISEQGLKHWIDKQWPGVTICQREE